MKGESVTSALPPQPQRWPALAAEEAFPPIPEAAGQARVFLRTAAESWDLPEPVLVDCLAIVSEIVGNVVRHARTPLTLRVSYDGVAVVIAATDGAVSVPEQHSAGDASEDGRGLLIIESLATEWGWHAAVVGKTLWARVVVDTA
jgi:anti-sigma regulatory factor (Ser/Thr protein kinase)